MKLNDILKERQTLSRADWNVIGRMSPEQLDDFMNYLENGDFDYDNPDYLEEYRDRLLKLGFAVPKIMSDDYMFAISDAIQHEIDMREVEDEFDQYRDYDEEDRAAAWDDRYQAFRNEY
jgi:hypothetical protein